MHSTLSFFHLNRMIKQKLLITIFALANLVTESFAQTFTEPLYLKTIHYNLDIKVDFEDRKIIAACGMTVLNPTAGESKIIPLLLYRLMKVSSIKDEKGNPFSYTLSCPEIG